MRLSELLIGVIVVFGISSLLIMLVSSLSGEIGTSVNSPQMTNFQSSMNTTYSSINNMTAEINENLHKEETNPISSFIMAFSAIYQSGILLLNTATYVPNAIGNTFVLFGQQFADTEVFTLAFGVIVSLVCVFIIIKVANFFRSGDPL